MGFDIECGCFGPDEPGKAAFVGMKSALFRDLLMVAGMAYIFLYRKYIWQFQKVLPETPLLQGSDHRN